MKKNILFFNATYEKKIRTFEAAKSLGLNISVVGYELPNWSKPFVDNYIYSDTYNIGETLSKLKKEHKKNPFDGVITFWDRDVIPVAVVAKELNLNGSSIEGAEHARNKRKMRETLSKHNVPCPKFYHVTNFEELQIASSQIKFPIIIKPVGASASKGIFKIENPNQLHDSFQKMVNFAKPENDKMFSFYQGEYLAEEFMEGQEVSIEGVIANGEIYIAGITEKLVDNYFEEYQHAFPARLEKNIEDEILDVTISGIKALELNNCGFHAEVMITNNGCKIVEINGRLGGDFITTHLVPIAKGIDITSINLLLVLNEPFDFTPTVDKGACARFLIAKNEGFVKEWKGIDEVRNMPGVIDFVIEKQLGEYVGLPPKKFHDTRIAYVITEGESTEKAIEYAREAMTKVRCVIDEQ